MFRWSPDYISLILFRSAFALGSVQTAQLARSGQRRPITLVTMVSTRSSKKYEYANLNNADSGSEDGAFPTRASSQSATPSKITMRKTKRVNVQAAAPRATATDDDDTSDDNAQTRPTHFTRKASSVAAAATGGGDGSGPSVIDRDRHDAFNVVALLPLVFLTLANFDWEVVWASADAEAAWTDEYFWQYWAATLTYFSVDTVWLWKVPTCVKSPGVIIKVCALGVLKCCYGKRITIFIYYVCMESSLALLSPISPFPLCNNYSTTL